MNSQYFSKKQIEAGEMQKLLDYLMLEAYGEGEYYNDIHIVPSADWGDFIVEWEQLPWDHSFGGNFSYVEEDEEVMLRRTFPDGHIEYFHDEETYQETLVEWLNKNQGWAKNEFGVWYNIKEQVPFDDLFKKETDKELPETHLENGIIQSE